LKYNEFFDQLASPAGFSCRIVSYAISRVCNDSEWLAKIMYDMDTTRSLPEPWSRPATKRTACLGTGLLPHPDRVLYCLICLFDAVKHLFEKTDRIVVALFGLRNFDDLPGFAHKATGVA
jgi:hypothetical protein